MTRNEAKEILVDEHLKYYNWFKEHDIKPNEVIIYEEDDTWVVCAADERAWPVDSSYAYYKNEELAIEDFIKRVRLEKILL